MWISWPLCLWNYIPFLLVPVYAVTVLYPVETSTSFQFRNYTLTVLRIFVKSNLGRSYYLRLWCLQIFREFEK